jgi:hypothetical protein
MAREECGLEPRRNRVPRRNLRVPRPSLHLARAAFLTLPYVNPSCRDLLLAHHKV